jgi:putative membrane protein
MMDFLLDFAGIRPSVWIAVAILCTAYVAAARLGSERPSRRQAAWFFSALLMLLFTFGGLQELSAERIFAMRMLQHLLLVMIVPPLLLLGTPGWMLRPVMLNRAVKPVARILTHPVVAYLLFCAVFVTPHLSPVLDWLCLNSNLDLLIHVAFVVAGVLMWWPILSPMPELPRISYPLQILYIFMLMVPMTAVAAPITFAEGVVYPWYLAGPHGWGLKPMEDQILGGLIMWIGQGIFLIFVFSAIFVEWARQQDDADEPAPPPRRRGHLQLLRSQAATRA